jgi:hypothetical protein
MPAKFVGKNIMGIGIVAKCQRNLWLAKFFWYFAIVLYFKTILNARPLPISKQKAYFN